MGSRFGGMASSYVTAIVLLVALFASSAECRPEPVLDEAAASAPSISSNDNGNGNDTSGIVVMALNSTASLVNGGRGSPSTPVSLTFCISRNCVYPGRGNAPCFCCAVTKPLNCYDTRDQCNSNCV